MNPKRKHKRKPRLLAAHAPGVRAMLAKHAMTITPSPIRQMTLKQRAAYFAEMRPKQRKAKKNPAKIFVLQIFLRSKNAWQTLGGTFANKEVAVKQGKELHKSFPQYRMQVIEK